MKNLSIVLLSLSLSACAGLSNEFSCDKTATGSCISVSEANQQAKKASNGQLTFVNRMQGTKGEIERTKDLPVTASLWQPKRTTEQINRLWIASYVDEKDNLHDEQVIYFSSAPSAWSGVQR